MDFPLIRITSNVLRAGALAAVALFAIASPASGQMYKSRDLVNNICCGPEKYDPQLANAWGIAFDPTGFAWVASYFRERAELFDGLGNRQPLSVRMEIPPLFNGGFVTGLAFNSGDNFMIPNSDAQPSPARFLFALLEGRILAWTPAASASAESTLAPIFVDNFDRGDRYTGLALAHTSDGDRLLAADIARKQIRVFDGSFAPMESSFVDPNLPPGFAPYNVRVLGGRIFVSYAIPNADGLDGASGAGSGLIDTFDLDGNFQSRLVSHGPLNAPWGMALAPANFGSLSNKFLVGNFGDGRINAFDPVTGAFLGALLDSTGAPVTIDGLRGIDFGNGRPTQPNNTLFYTAGPTFAVVSIYGRLDRVCGGDFTGDKRATVQDIFAFLNAWFAGSASADFDGGNTVDVQDIFAFLGAWFAACP